MINATILLLVYYYDYEDRNHRLLKYITANHCGAYLPFNIYLTEPLQKVFSRVIVYDYLKRRAEIGMNSMNAEVIDLVRKEHPEYVLWVSFHEDIQPATFDAIRREGAKVVGWFFDDEWRFDTYSKYFIPYLDYFMTNALEAVPKYEELGARVIQAIPNTGVAVERDWTKPNERYDVSFVGTRFYADRYRWTNELESRNISVHLFGKGFGGYVSFEEMLDIFWTSRINLNFSRGVVLPGRQIKGRIFQVCMAGGFLLTEYAPGIEKYFEIDKEIACFDNPEEMADKISYYLSHDDERRAIAQAGWKRATREYTSANMVRAVFSEIEAYATVKGDGKDRSPAKMEMPASVRRDFSHYNFTWGRALLETDDKTGMWREALGRSLYYRPQNYRALYYYLVGYLPFPVRPPLFKLFDILKKIYEKLYFWRFR